MAERIPLFLNLDAGEHFPDEFEATDTVTFGQLTIDASGTGIIMNNKKITGMAAATADGDALAYGQSGANLAGLDVDTADITMNGQKITGLTDGASASQDAATVAQVEALVATGSSFKEPVHNAQQLVNGGTGVGGIQSIGIWNAVNQPVVGDQVIVKSNTQTRTYSFVANIGAESVATDVSIETDAATAMQRFRTRFNADAGTTEWTAQYHTTGPFGNHVYIYETKVPTDTLSDSRIYGVWTTQADFQVVDFNNAGTPVPYTQVTAQGTASTTDPGGGDGTFGLGRAWATLIDGEIHFSSDNDTLYAWDAANDQWNQISGGGAVPDATSGSGGGTKGVVTADEDKGLEIMSGAILEVKLGTNGGLEFDGSGDVAVDLDTTPGLQLAAGGLSWLPDTNRGLDVDGTGAFIDLATDPGLQFTTGNLEAKVDGATGAMQKGSAGLQVKVEPATGLQITASGLGGVADTTAGLEVSASGFGIDLAATDPGLQFDGSGDLEAKVNTTTGAMDKDANGLKVKADAAAGIEITGDGVAIDLATSDPGLQFDGSGDLEAKVDSTEGLDKDADGIFVKLLAAGGIQFDGSGNLQLNLDDTPDTLDVDASGLKVVGLPLQYKINDVAVSSNLTAANASELVDGGSTILHTHPGIAESGRIENDLEVDESIAVGDPVFWNATTDRVGKADASVVAKGEVFGLARTAQATPGSDATVVSVGTAAGVITGATPGDNYFLQASGGIASTAPSGGPRRVIQMGWAINATDLWVHIIDKGRRRS